MSDLGSIISVGLSLAAAATGNFWYFAASTAASYIDANNDRRKAERKARQEFNDAQHDRLELVDVTAEAPRTLALGRVRAVEGIRRRWTSGTHSEKFTAIVSCSATEIDGFEGWYVDDMPVTLDGGGYVTQAPFTSGEAKQRNTQGTLNGSGGATVTLAYTPVVGSVKALWFDGSGSYGSGPLTVSVAGAVVTLSGGPPSASYMVWTDEASSLSYLRIRPFTGSASQNIGSGLAAEYPGKITATDKFGSIAGFTLDLLYSPDVFPQGRPNVTPLFRGARCYDPRLDSTVPGGSGSHRFATPSTWAFSENPALLMLRYAMWGYGLNLPASCIRMADVMAAANACDVSTVFTLRKPDTSTATVTLPRYRAAMVVAAGEDPRAVLDRLAAAMAGEWAFDGPELRMRAGAMASPVFTANESWIANDTSADGEVANDSAVVATQAVTREQRVNLVGGQCVDQDQRWQTLPYPAARDSTLIAAKGEKRADVDFEAVSHIAHAQHLAGIKIRRAQAGMQLKANMGPEADLLELFDVGAVNLAGWGISGKTVEVTGLRGGPQGITEVQLREIASAIFDPVAELTGRDPAPDSGLRAPWEVAKLPAITVTSGTAPTLDGSVITRTVVAWAAVADEWIRNGGAIEVQYTRADEALPAGDWAMWEEPGSSVQAIIGGLMAGRPYVFRAREVQKMPLVRGAWSPWVIATIAAPPLVSTSGLASGAATEVLSELVSAKTYPKGFAAGPKFIDGPTFTPSVNAIAEVTVKFDGHASGTAGAEWGGAFAGVACELTSDLSVDGGDAEVWTFDASHLSNANKVQGASGMDTTRAAYTLAGRFPVTAGQTYRAGLFLKGAVPDFGISFVANVDGGLQVQVTLIKR